MKVTYNWLKDFAAIKIPARRLAEKLTMAGLEVTSLEEKQGDYVFEIEVTSNRPDCLSVAGIAREAAAVTNSKFKIQNVKPKFKIKNLRKKGNCLAIKIENRKDCPLYTAKIIEGVKVGPAPEWLKARLELVGCRSVNNIVDITNYVLFELGEPLHAFDLDKLASSPARIIVRRANRGEKIVTIDGIERVLDENILVIASILSGPTDQRTNGPTARPIALAGIMGGKGTEVTSGTKNILLEAAVFNPVLVRRARQSLGLASESAYRFERGVNPQIVKDASWRAAQLIRELAGGCCALAQSSGAAQVKVKRISLGAADVADILGINIAPARIKAAFGSLGFRVKNKTKNNFYVGVPAQRPDVNLAVDLVEEIARIFGYENIPRSLPAIAPPGIPDERRQLVSLAKNTLAGLGFNEVITYSLIDRSLLDGPAAAEAVEIVNPLSREQEVLRTALLPGLLACIAYNLNRRQEYINIFEITNAFSAGKGAPQEELRLGIGLCGTKPLLLQAGLVKEEAGFLHLKGALEALFARLGIEEYSFIAAPDNPLTIDIYAGKEKAGAMAGPAKGVLEKFEIKNKAVFLAEISLEKVFSCARLERRFAAPPKYPGIARDISFVLKGDVPVKSIMEAVRETGGPFLRSVKVADYYRGAQIPAGFRGLTISCFYRSDERTLAEAEINPLHTLACGVLTERFGAKIRG